jgi:hypothetical protein
MRCDGHHLSFVIPTVGRNLLLRLDGLAQSAAKSSQVGFEGAINATFFSRRHFFISVSRAMALFTY